MKVLCVGLSVVLALGAATTGYSQTSDHLVPMAELESVLAAKSAQRDANIAEIRSLFRHQAVQEELDGLIDPHRLETSVAALDDATLRDLGAKSRQINEEIAASGMTKWLLITAVVVIGLYLALVLTIAG